MSKIIPLRTLSRLSSNIISEKPLVIRWADWEGGCAILTVKEEAAKFEIHRREVINQRHSHIAYVPNHFTLKDGMEYTLAALLRYRNEPEKMHEVYYLAGLMESLLTMPNKVLRTVMVRNYYQVLIDLKNSLSVSWHGNARRFLFPLLPSHYDQNSFTNSIAQAQTLKELYEAIREGTEEQFLILGSEYVFYVPRVRR
jgi:hypothetical protein